MLYEEENRKSQETEEENKDSSSSSSEEEEGEEEESETEKEAGNAKAFHVCCPSGVGQASQAFRKSLKYSLQEIELLMTICIKALSLAKMYL